MRGLNSNSSVILSGLLLAAGPLALMQCGSDDSGAPASDSGQDTTNGEAAATDDGGADGTADSTVDAGEDVVVTQGDGAADAKPDATLDAPPDARPDALADAAPATDGGEGGADADAGPALTPCDVDAQTPCVGASSVKCCSGFCVDTALDPANCGHCGTACTSHQFCTGTACDDAILANVCDNPRGTVVLDAFDPDNEAGAALGIALATICAPSPPTIVQRSQDEAGVLAPNTDRPITGVGNTFINGGGGYGQRGLAYLDQAGLSTLYLVSTGVAYQIENRIEDAAVVDAAASSLTVHHDFFFVQLTVEPQGGTLCFSVVGILAPGTVAGGYFVSTQVIPNRATYPDAWYVFEWTDTNNDAIPNSGDTFTKIASGK